MPELFLGHGQIYYWSLRSADFCLAAASLGCFDRVFHPGLSSTGAQSIQLSEDGGDTLADGLVAGWQLDFGLERGFVGGGNAGEFFDLACTRFGVEPFGIALFANFQGRANAVSAIMAMPFGLQLASVSSQPSQRKNNRVWPPQPVFRMQVQSCQVPSAACQMVKSTGSCLSLVYSPRSGLPAPATICANLSNRHFGERIG